jgi:cellulose synthase/poly-beta-1,6-N-acetylglucosamine synthase-like glycosyltransferase
MLLWVPVGFLAGASLWLSIETIVATLPLRAHEPQASNRPHATVLIPAHNESTVIAETLRSVLQETNDGDHVIVVADNCHDDTAEIAKSFPRVTVLERTDDTQSGKGFALQFALDELRRSPAPMLSIVVMVDADCRLGIGAIDKLIATVEETGRPAQSLYRIGRGETKSPSRMLSFLAITIKNHVRPLALYRLRIGNLLTGSGMAFPIRCLDGVSLANDNTADDMELGCELALQGTIPTFCPTATVDSLFPTESEDQGVQRKRWIHGHLRTMTNYVPRLLWRGLCRLDFRQWVYAMELAVPPLSLLVAACMLLLPATAAVGFARQSPFQFATVATSFTLLTASVLASWFAFAKTEVPLRALAQLPQHLVLGLAASGQALVRRQGWVNTPRSNTEAR